MVLPLAMPGVIATGIYIFITSWNEYLYASVLAGQEVRTLTVAVQTLIGEYEIAWGLLTAGGVVGALPVTLLFMVDPATADRRHDPRRRERLKP